MDFTVQNTLEQAINRKVEKILGNGDPNLSLMLKLSLLPDAVNLEEQTKIINNIKQNNKIEKFYFEDELKLTMDIAGNIVPLLYIKPNEQSQTDTGSIIFEPK